MLGCQFKLTSLVSQHSKFLMGTEIVWRHLQRRPPPRDAFGQLLIDVLESLLGSRVASLANPVEDTPCLGLLLCFITEEGVLECYVLVCWIEPHGFGELIAGSLVFAYLQ
jgi:hypothetical protein